MAEAYYEPTPATDGATMNPVPGAVFQVFEIADTTFTTPLSLRVGSGNPTTSVTASDTLATLPGVYVTSDNYEHIWVSGSFQWRRDSIDGAKKAIEASATSASNSAASAAASEQAAVDAASLVNAPADSAVKTLINDSASQTATALTATIAEGITSPEPGARSALEKFPATPKKGTARPLVAFVFDDFPAVDHSYTRPMLATKGIKATFAAFVNGVGIDEARWQQLRDVVADGHEVANHSVTHATLDAAASDALLTTEILGAHDTIVSHDVTPTGFVWPNNISDVKPREYARQLYRYGMGGGDGINKQPLRSYHLARTAITDSVTLATTQAQIDAAKTGNYLLCYVIHTANLTATGKSVLEQTIDYAIAQGVTPVTVSEALDLVGNVYDAGESYVGSAGATYTVVDGTGKLHASQLPNDMQITGKVRSSDPKSAGLPSRTLVMNDNRMALGFNDQFSSNTAKSFTIRLPEMNQFHILVVDLTILSQQFTTNATPRAYYAAKVYVAVGSGDTTRAILHPYIAPFGFTVAPAVSVTRDAVTKATSLVVTFTPTDADGYGAIVATIPV